MFSTFAMYLGSFSWNTAAGPMQFHAGVTICLSGLIYFTLCKWWSLRDVEISPQNPEGKYNAS